MIVATARLPLRIRFGVAVLAVIAVLLIGGATAVLQVGGFVVPARSANRYQLIVLIERIRPGTAAVLRQTDIGFTALGLDHGFRSRAAPTDRVR